MMTHTLNPALQPADSKRAFGGAVSLADLKIIISGNYEIVLAVITLFALLIGWLGGSVTHSLPNWAVMSMALIAFVAGGYSGVMGAIAQARQGILDIDFLMIAAAFGAAAIGEWEEGALLLFLFTLSGGLETYAMDRTRHAIEALAELRPEIAYVRRDGTEVLMPVSNLEPGDVVIVRPGERLPVDGTILKGASAIDQSPITGESMPIYKTLNDTVYAGSINGSGALDVRVDRHASESTLSRIIDLVQEARKDATPTQQFIDRFSSPYTYVVITATLLAIVLPRFLLHEPFGDTLYRAMTLLVVASPCALIISTPASVLSAIAAAARYGVLFKGGGHLENLAGVSIIAFDKTGTLTHGKAAVTDIVPLPNATEDEVLQVAASAELSSEHPLARAIVNAAQDRQLALTSPLSLKAVAGHGIQAEVFSSRGVRYVAEDNDDRQEDDRQDKAQGAAPDGRLITVLVGNEKLFASKNIALSSEIRRVGEQLRHTGKTAMLVARYHGQSQQSSEVDFLGWIGVADTLRPHVRLTLDSLHKLGVERTVMLTGDNHVVADAIGGVAGVDEVYSELLPEHKVEKIRQLTHQGQVAMIGDGVNDAPALAVAQVGIAIGAGGTDVALETADVVLMSGDLSRLPFAVGLGRRTARIVKQNVVFSISVIIALVLTTLVAPAIFPGFRLPLPLGVVGHEGSTLIVVANGLRLLMMRPMTM